MKIPKMTKLRLIVLIFLATFLLKLSTAQRIWKDDEDRTPLRSDNVKNCFGTDQPSQRLNLKDGKLIEFYKNRYGGCQRLTGNLEIPRFTAADVANVAAANLSSFDKIFSELREITGYLHIDSTYLVSFRLPKLQYIWGLNLRQHYRPMTNETTVSRPDNVGYALSLMNNDELEVFSAPSLRVINTGDVYISLNARLCHPSTMIDWRQLLGDRWQSRLHVNMTNVCMDGRVEDVKCHASCENNKCWSARANDCQIIFRDECAAQCDNQMCFKHDGDISSCCHPSCAGGCFGPTNKDCYGCSALEIDGRGHSDNKSMGCVNECEKEFIIEQGHNIPRRNPHITYHYLHWCYQQCPSHTVIHQNLCLSQCPQGYWQDDERKCKKCVRDSCETTCSISDGTVNDDDTPVHSGNIHVFKNCSIFHGNLLLGHQTFIEYSEFSNGPMVIHRPLTVADLDVFLSLTRITGSINIWRAPMTDLSMFRNLRIIDGTAVHLQNALLITQMPNLRELHLKSLREITKGNVVISNNPHLCYANTTNWKDGIMKDQGKELRFHGNGEEHGNCESVTSSGETVEVECDTNCAPPTGCWGAGPTLCFECDKYMSNETCVAECDTDNGFYVHDGNQCSNCDPACTMCSGPGVKNCLGDCKNVRHNGLCADNCPLTHYRDENNICQPCHLACSGLGFVGATESSLAQQS